MCGFSGFLSNKKSAVFSENILSKMADKIAHRGPDDCGIWYDSVNGIGLTHRRLSVIELSEAGHQPMMSHSGRYVIVYNGEIYNYLKLRKMLEADSLSIPWNGHSDTETLLACIEAWGVEKTLMLSHGMFAFALWDKHENKLVLARDRFGEKPLYYGWQNSNFLFGSELKSIKAHPDFIGELDRGAISLFLRYAYIPAPHSVYKDISKLEAGSWLELRKGETAPQVQAYWSAVKAINKSKENIFQGSPEEASTQLEKLISDSIEQQMVADVPVGAFLSGGIDSSLVAAVMQSKSKVPINTFTIGFNEKEYNEAIHAKAVANYLKTDHTELYVPPKIAQEVIPSLPVFYDEPFADASQIPTLLLSKLAREKVTVSLSGDAGDELFCGYNRYHMTDSIWKKLSRLPICTRKFLGDLILKIPPNYWDSLAKVLIRKNRPRLVGNKIHKGAKIMASCNRESLYLNLVSHHANPASVVLQGYEPKTLQNKYNSDIKDLDDVEYMMAMDTVTYLTDNNLAKIDRAAMAMSLETRVPLLDYRIFEFSWSLPQEIKMHLGQGKWPLRNILYKYVPRDLIDRPKMGFGIPIDQWLRNDLKDWAEVLLSEERLYRDNIFNVTAVRTVWREHLLGKQDHSKYLWNILMFQSWFENQ